MPAKCNATILPQPDGRRPTCLDKPSLTASTCLNSGGMSPRACADGFAKALVGSWEIFWYFFFGKKSTYENSLKNVSLFLLHCTEIQLFLLSIIGLLFASCQQQTSNAPEGFDIHPLFKLELVASEPLVFDPVDMEFDEQGRAFVLEMPGYPLRDEQSRLILLKDNDGDGAYDERKVFADSLLLASSFMPYKGGMLVAAPPSLLFIKDTDGDEVADEYQEIMSGFSAGNLQHNFNGLTYGLDNWIYAANGGNSGEPYFVADSSLKLDMRGDDFRFKLNPNQVERVGESSGGFELAFDQWGRMYETHNLEHVSQLVIEGKYLEGVPTSPSHALTIISDHEENGLSRIYPIGEQDTRVNHPEQSGYFSGSCGITFYGGNAFPEGFNHNLFVADVVLNLIHLDVLSSNGTSMKTSRKRDKVEFIASNDRAFRPVNLTTGPDGALYLMDMHRDVIEHPEWIPDEMEVNMDLQAGKEKGRIYRITPKDDWKPYPLQSLSDDLNERVQALNHPNQWLRMTAHRLLLETPSDEAIKPLEALFRESTSPFGRLHALWVLEGMGKLSSDILAQGIDDANPGVRENALKVVEPRLQHSSFFIEKALQSTTDKDARVALQATLALSTLQETEAKIFGETIQDAMLKLVEDPKTDCWMSMAIAAAVKNKQGDFCEVLMADRLTPLSEVELETVITLSRLMGQKKMSNDMEKMLASWEKSSISASEKAQVLEAFTEGWKRREDQKIGGLSTFLAQLEEVEKAGEIAVIRESSKLRRVMNIGVSPQVNKMVVEARKSVMDGTLSPEERLEMLKLIALDDLNNREELLYNLLDSRTPLVLQKESLEQLKEANGKDVGEKLLNLWQGLGPEARKMAGNILLYKSHNHDLLLSALESGKINAGELNLDLERRRVLLFSEDDQVKARAEALFSDAGVVQRKEAMEKMRPALALNGDISKGQALFTAACSSCHQYGDMGKNVGPILTEISRKSKESLLHDILDPNAAVDTRYLNYQVRTKSGEIHTGMVFKESDSEVGLRMNGGNEVTIPKNDVEKFTSLGISLMPEGLEAGLQPKDMADLLAFLQNGSE